MGIGKACGQHSHFDSVTVFSTQEHVLLLCCCVVFVLLLLWLLRGNQPVDGRRPKLPLLL